MKNAIVSMQMKRVLREAGAKYAVIEVDSLKAMEQLLNSYHREQA